MAGYDTPDARAAQGNTAFPNSDQFWSHPGRHSARHAGRHPAVSMPLLAEATADANGIIVDDPGAAPTRVAVRAPSEAQDAAALPAGPDASAQRAAAAQPGVACADFHYDDQGTSADNPRINNWQANSTPGSKLTLDWNAAHADLMTKPITENHYKAHFGDDLDGVVTRWMQGHPDYTDGFDAKKKDVIQRNHNHYKSLDTKPDFMGKTWTLDLGDCTPPPAPAPIEPPRVQEAPPAPAPAPRQEASNGIIVDNPQPAPTNNGIIVDNPQPQPQVAERLNWRILAGNHYGNVIINGVPTGAGETALMYDGSMRHHRFGVPGWETVVQGAEVPREVPFMRRPMIEERFRRHRPPVMMYGGQQNMYGGGQELEWQRRRHWQERRMAMYGQSPGAAIVVDQDPSAQYTETY